MRVVIVSNSGAGSGAASTLSPSFERALHAAGHHVTSRRAGEPLPELNPQTLVIALGGDGTVHHLLPALLASGAAVYHIPAGNENLFSREMGASRAPAALIDAITEARTDLVDAAECNGRPFILMASSGPDASVIRRLARSRTRANGHAAYILPVAVELLRPMFPRIWLNAAGRELVAGQTGLIIVANSRRYALSLNPARDADIRDALLDAVFMPCSTSLGALTWYARMALGLHLHHPRVIRARAPEFLLRLPGNAPLQLDGEWSPLPAAPPQSPDAPLALHFRARPRALRVLLPSHSAPTSTTTPPAITKAVTDPPKLCASSRSSE